MELENRIKASIDLQIAGFSDQDPEIYEMIVKAAKGFCSNNPRELKRLLNVFRMQYFIRAAARSLNVWTAQNTNTRSNRVASDRQLINWIILSLKWPEVVRWLGLAPTWPEYGKPESFTTYFRDRLKLLEDLGRKCNQENKDWLNEASAIPELEVNKNRWIKDKGLESFFRNQATLGEDRLSTSAGDGLY
jgi:hypothetical protein